MKASKMQQELVKCAQSRCSAKKSEADCLPPLTALSTGG